MSLIKSYLYLCCKNDVKIEKAQEQDWDGTLANKAK